MGLNTGESALALRQESVLLAARSWPHCPKQDKLTEGYSADLKNRKTRGFCCCHLAALFSAVLKVFVR
jgi:hypothetical protein